jgi:uncharacterized membrane protein
VDAPSLAPALTALRLTLHVLAAAVWVGGQITVAGLLPSIRRLGEGAPRAVAAAFGRLQWPAFVVLLGTGAWNVSALSVGAATGAWTAVLFAKVGVVLLAGGAAFAHQRARTRAGLAMYGAAAAVASLAALVLGVLLAG